MKLITGASGLIGNSLMSHGDWGIDVKPCDFVNQCDFRNVVIPSEITAVYHMAGLSRVHQVDDSPELAIGLAKELDNLICKSGPDRLFVLASSKEVLGDVRDADLSSPLAPKSLYAELKAYQEKVALRYAEMGWPVKIVRFSTVYGEIHRDYESRVIPSFIRSAIRNQPLVVCGPNKLLEPTNLAIVRDHVLGLDTNSNQLTILGSGQPISLLDLAELIVELTESKSEIITKEASMKHGDFSSAIVRPEFNLVEQLFGEIQNYRSSLRAF